MPDIDDGVTPETAADTAKVEAVDEKKNLSIVYKGETFEVPRKFGSSRLLMVDNRQYAAVVNDILSLIPGQWAKFVELSDDDEAELIEIIRLFGEAIGAGNS